jgi:hypothetical protein
MSVGRWAYEFHRAGRIWLKRLQMRRDYFKMGNVRGEVLENAFQMGG